MKRQHIIDKFDCAKDNVYAAQLLISTLMEEYREKDQPVPRGLVKIYHNLIDQRCEIERFRNRKLRKTIVLIEDDK